MGLEQEPGRNAWAARWFTFLLPSMENAAKPIRLQKVPVELFNYLWLRLQLHLLTPSS